MLWCLVATTAAEREPWTPTHLCDASPAVKLVKGLGQDDVGVKAHGLIDCHGGDKVVLLWGAQRGEGGGGGKRGKSAGRVRRAQRAGPDKRCCRVGGARVPVCVLSADTTPWCPGQILSSEIDACAPNTHTNWPAAAFPLACLPVCLAHLWHVGGLADEAACGWLSVHQQEAAQVAHGLALGQDVHEGGLAGA